MKPQWDLIHNPEFTTGLWDGMEDGASIGSANYSNVVEGIRCSRYSGTSTLNIKYLDAQIRQSSLTWNYPSLLDNEPYGNFTLTMDYDDLEVINIGLISANGNRVSIGESGKQIHFGVRNKNLSDSPELANKFRDYLSVDKTNFVSQAENLLTKMDGMTDISIPIQSIPDCWFYEIGNARRIEYLKKLSSRVNDNINYILKLVNTVKKENITSFFTELGKTTLFHTFKNTMSLDNNTAFIKSATLLYYQQNDLKDKLFNLPYNRLFVNQAREGTFGASISNSFTSNQTTITITGNISVVTGTINPYGVAVPSGTKAFQAYSYSVGYCDLIGLELNSDFGHLKASMHNDIVPLPAFYFDWINTNRQNEVNCKMIDATITIASLAVGVSELRVAIKGGQYIYAAYLGVGAALTTYNLVRLNSDIDKYFDQVAKSSVRVKDFFEFLDNFAILYDVSNIVVSRVVTKDNKQFFNDFVAAWTISKDGVFEHILNHPEGGSQKAQEVKAEFQKLVDEITLELNK